MNTSNGGAQSPLRTGSADNPVVTTRRKFMLQCSATAAAIAAMPAAVTLGGTSKVREVSLDRIPFSAFRRLVGTHFRVYANALPMKLELIEVSTGQESSMVQGSRKVEPDQFSLIFQGPKNHPLEQNTYAFAHERLGEFAMFIVPIWDLAGLTGVRHYEAVFNRPSELARMI